MSDQKDDGAVFRSLFACALDPILITDFKGRILDCNESAGEKLGGGRAELLSKTIFDFIREKSPGDLKKRFARLEKRGSDRAPCCELVHAAESGACCPPLEVTLLAVMYGGAHAVLHIVRNADPVPREGGGAFGDEGERCRLIMDATDVGVWDWDLASGRAYYSPAFLSLLDETELPPEYDAWEQRIHPDDRAAALDSLRAHLEGRTDAWHCDYRLRKRGGEWRWVEGRGRVVERDGGGHPRRMVGHTADIMERKLTEQRLREREKELRDLSARLITVREEERNRIARNIHDDLGHLVMNIKMNLFLADMMLAGGRETLRAFLHEMKDQVDSLLEMIQFISMEIRPAVLYDLGLADALRFYIRKFSEQTNISCVVRSLPDIPHLSEETAITIYRIVQEVFINMFRHSGCTEITLDFSIASGRVTLIASDNGRGITPAEIEKGDSIGIMGMKERALSLGGELVITGVPGKGTTVCLSFPLPAAGGGE